MFLKIKKPLIWILCGLFIAASAGLNLWHVFQNYTAFLRQEGANQALSAIVQVVKKEGQVQFTIGQESFVLVMKEPKPK